MARAANAATISSSAESANILSPAGGVLDVRIQCDSGSAAPLLVRVENRNNSIHGAAEQVSIAAGSSLEFWALPDNPITGLYVQGSGGTATYSFTVRCAG